MQEETDKLFAENNKKELLLALGRVIHRERMKMNKGINLFSYEYELGNGILSKVEKGMADSRITTLWKIVNAFGYTCSEFLKLVEDELPSNFNFYN